MPQKSPPPFTEAGCGKNKKILEGLLRGEFAAPVLRGRLREARLKTDFVVDLKGNGLRGLATAFALSGREAVPMRAGGTGLGAGIGGCAHNGSLSVKMETMD
jgi:hypothetical protein